MSKDTRQEERLDRMNEAETAKADLSVEAGRDVREAVKRQILKDVGRCPKVLLNWVFRLGEGKPTLADLYPKMVAIGYGTELEVVCDCISELVADGKVAIVGNIPAKVTGAVLVEHVKAWDAARHARPHVISTGARAALVQPIRVTGKNLTNEQVMAMLS